MHFKVIIIQKYRGVLITFNFKLPVKLYILKTGFATVVAIKADSNLIF